MASKTFMAVLGVLLATILLVSSEVAAGKQQEQKVNDASVVYQKYDRCDHGCCQFGYRGCFRCCKNADEMPDVQYVPSLTTE